MRIVIVLILKGRKIGYKKARQEFWSANTVELWSASWPDGEFPELIMTRAGWSSKKKPAWDWRSSVWRSRILWATL